MRQLQKQQNKEEKSGKGFMIFFIALTLIMMAIVVYAIWYVNADPKLVLGKYKGLTVNVSTSTASNDKLSETTDPEEIIKQAVLNRIIKEAKFSHIGQKVDKRYEDFLKYYGDMVQLYDQYNTLEEMAKGYYGYKSLEAFENAVMDYAEVSVKQEMLLAEIAKKEGFSVTDEIFNQYIGNYLKAYDYKEDEVDKYLENYGKEEVYEVILADYTLDYLVSVNKINIK